MSFTQAALQLWPCWMLGILMIYMTWRSEHRNILRIEPAAILKFLKFLVMITLFRFVVFKFLAPQAMVDAATSMANLIPIGAIFGVFWEDAVHSMPLVLAGLAYGSHKWYPWLSKVALAIVMLSFAAGHIYQGTLAACGISLYILVSMGMGKKYGFGTVMICHILYDLTTILSFRWMLG